MTSPTPRRRGRPPKPRSAKPPRHVPLPFDAERRALATAEKQPLRIPAQLGVEPASGAASLLSQLRWGFASQHERERVLRLLDQRRDSGVSGLADNSRRTLRADWLTWRAYCLWAHAPVLPALFADIQRFITLLVDAGRQKATVEHHLWTLRQMHRRLGLADPMGDVMAEDWWRDLVRMRLSAEQRQAAPMALRHVVAMTAALSATDTPVRIRRAAPADRDRLEALQRHRRMRDLAMINVAYDLMSRSAELVSLSWDRLAASADGSGTYRLGRSKTDQEGLGVTQYLRPETMAMLSAWRAVAPSPNHVFTAVRERSHAAAELPLSTTQVTAIFRRAARLAGFGALPFSGHSARVGAALDMVEAGATAEEAQQAGRWKDGRMVARYAARPLARRAGQSRFKKLAAMLDTLPD
ncbi:tyrosine-type recombinase/integrase [Xanthomonas sp. NCPPB 2632]|uniref:tyrosine-type recombinase/integrase n=1 Tax=Xanthomonas sp. NCPPB 2632 TaxID=3240912 RepID=UPI003513F152